MSMMNSLARWFGISPREPVIGKQYPGSVGKTAKPVTFDSAMTVGALFASIRLLSETVAGLPLQMYELKPDGSREPADHDLIKLLKYRPNRRQTRIEFFEQLMLNLVSSGNAYVKKGMIGKRLVALTVINSGSVVPEQLENGDIIYEVTDSKGRKESFTEKEIWHVRLFGNGILGLSPLAAACRSVGVADASLDKITDMMASEAPPGSLNMPTGSNPTTEQREVLRTETVKMISGQSIPVFSNGAKFESIQLTPADLELISVMRFSLEDIARIMGVPSVLINDMAASTVWGSGIGSVIDASYKFNFRPYLEKIELSMLVNLMPMADWEKYEFEFDFDAILRASKKDRVEMYSREIQSGQSSPNECRKEEGRSPKPGGDQLFVPNNTIPIEQVGRVQPKLKEVNNAA